MPHHKIGKQDTDQALENSTRSQLSDEEVTETVLPDEMTSPLITLPLKSHDPDHHYSCIKKSLCINFDEKMFLPANAIPSLTSREVIEPILAPLATEQVPLDSLVSYVLHPKKPARRLFLTLAFCDYMNELTHFYAQGLCDENLPLQEVGNDSRGADGGVAIRSLDYQQHPSARWTLPPRWGERQIYDFVERQWHFLAPVFSRDRFLYVLYKKCPLPFLKKLPGPNGGFQGSVDEIVIHEGHQKVFVSLAPTNNTLDTTQFVLI